MISGRSAKGSYFECVECGNRIHRAAYRASCPSCDGRLRSIRVAPDGTRAGQALRRGGERP